MRPEFLLDDAGAPRLLYHGSPSEFSAFDPCASMDGGIYFTADRSLADYFAKDEDGEYVTLHAVYLSLKNPKVIDLGDSDQPLQEQMKAIFMEAAAEGHDGAVLRNVPEFNGRGTQYVAFDVEQIHIVETLTFYEPRQRECA